MTHLYIYRPQKSLKCDKLKNVTQALKPCYFKALILDTSV